MQRVLHCYAFGREGAWEAICIDLDLAVQGGSFEEIASLLQEAIVFHLERVMELPEKDRARLLNRRVPWHVRLRYALEAFFFFMRRRDGGPFEHRYTIPYPA
jgi:hypothetical protein